MSDYEKTTKEELKKIIDEVSNSNDVVILIGKAIFSNKKILLDTDTFTLYEKIKVISRNA